MYLRNNLILLIICFYNTLGFYLKNFNIKLNHKIHLNKVLCSQSTSYTSSTADSSDVLKGYEGFIRNNPMSDKFDVKCFHHVEFYCGDALNTCNRFLHGLGMHLISKSDQSSGNTLYSSYCLESGSTKMIFTAPLGGNYHQNESEKISQGIEEENDMKNTTPFPSYNEDNAYNFFRKHGTAVKAVAIEVDSVIDAYNTILSNGGKGIIPPETIQDHNNINSKAELAEVVLYGDVNLRLINLDEFKGNCFPNFKDIESSREGTFGIEKFDHIVGNLWSLQPRMEELMQMTGFHTFAEFVADDVGTVDSGLNSIVLASNNEKVLLPLNEPTFGTKKKSQIQTYLEQNNGEGVQHIALRTNDIFYTMRKMREMSLFGGFEFMESQPDSYYDNLFNRIGEDAITKEELESARELGVLVDKDDQGVLLQIFTKPVGDRPTLFLEIIQRIGCIDDSGNQKPGCGGFGKGNFKDLFQSIEDYESTLKI